MKQITVAMLLVTASAHAADPEWVEYSDRGDVRSYSREMPGSNVLAMRGVMTVDVPFCTLLAVYLDVDRAVNWVDMLAEIVEHPIEGGDDAIERHLYDMPWPATDREFVFRRTVAWSPSDESVTITYRSTDDPRHPVQESPVRAVDHGSYWRFHKVDDGHTEIEAVAMVDPMGSLPAWLFNAVQRAWPRNSIHGLLKEVARTDLTSSMPSCPAKLDPPTPKPLEVAPAPDSSASQDAESVDPAEVSTP